MFLPQEPDKRILFLLTLVIVASFYLQSTMLKTKAILKQSIESIFSK